MDNKTNELVIVEVSDSTDVDIYDDVAENWPYTVYIGAPWPTQFGKEQQ